MIITSALGVFTCISDKVSPALSYIKGVRQVTTRQQSRSKAKSCKSTNGVNDSIDQNLLNTLGFTPNSLASIQRQDKDIGTILSWMFESKARPGRERVHDKSPTVRHLWLLWEQLVVVDGVLYKKWENTNARSRLTLVVPKTLIKSVLEANHDAVLSGHLGVKKTLSRIRHNYYWHQMKETVRNYVRACNVCGARKRPNKSPRAPLKNYQQGAPLDRIAIDILGPFPESDAGNKYVLVVGDTFTKWIEAYPIPDQCSKTVADKIVHEFIARFGTPFEIHSDQGRNFESALFTEMCNALKLHKTRTSSYHPQSNGFIERFNQTLANMIASYVSKHQRDWDVNIQLLTAAYRSTVHPTTGFSPNYLMLGREVNTPLEVTLGLRQNETPNNVNEYVVKMREQMNEACELAREQIGKTAERQKRDYDARLCHNSFEVGDLVYCRDTTRKKGLSPKLNPDKWQGPYVVVRKLSDLLFEIKQNKSQSKVVHHDRIKSYSSEVLPDWVPKMQEKVLSGQDTNTRSRAVQTNM